MTPDYNVGEYPYINQENYSQRRPPREFNPEMTEETEESNMAVPNQTMTIREIYERSLRGVAPVLTDEQYLDEEDLDRIQSLPSDLTDLDLLRDKINQISADIEEAIEKRDNDTDEPQPVPVPEPEPEPDEPVEPIE